jgi:hypothetical protein
LKRVRKYNIEIHKGYFELKKPPQRPIQAISQAKMSFFILACKVEIFELNNIRIGAITL